MKLNTAEFKDAVANVLQFAGDSKSASGGIIKVSPSDQGSIQLEAYDDHTWICVRIGVYDWEITDNSPPVVYVGKADLKAFAAPIDTETFETDLPFTESDPGCFSDASEMVTQPHAEVGGFWIAVDRWKKLGSLKPAGLPMKLTSHSDGGFLYGSFRYGGNVVGLLSYLDEAVLTQEGLA